MNITAFNPAAAHSAPSRFDKSALWASTTTAMPKILVENGRYAAYVEGQLVGQPQAELDVVLLDEYPKGRACSRTYFGRKDNPAMPASYDPKNTDVPSCHSVDGKVPAPDSKFPQHSSCEGCPQNAKGSGATADGRACRYGKTVAVNVPAFGQTVFALRLSSQAIFAAGDNARNIYGLFSLNSVLGNYVPQEVVVKLTQPDGITGGTRFSPCGMLDFESAKVMVALSQDPIVAETMGVGRTYAPALAAPAPVLSLPVYQAPAPVYAQPAPVYQAPAPMYQAPAPVYAQPAPVYQAPAPVYQAPAPVYAQPEPVVAVVTAPMIPEVPRQPAPAPVAQVAAPAAQAVAAPVAPNPAFKSRLSAAFGK
jgi:hypothetical protein